MSERLKIVALVQVDLSRDFFGAASMLGAELAGRSVLAHTLDRLGRVGGVDEIVLASKEEEAERVTELCRGTSGWVRTRVVKYRRAENPLWAAVRAARAFGRYGWRGGIAGTTYFDEMYDPVLIHGILEQAGAGALLLVSAGSALLDVEWTERLVGLYREQAGHYPLAFCQGPPGLCGAVFGAEILAKLAQGKAYPGRLFSYDPAAGCRADPIVERCNLPLPLEVVRTFSRFTADNRRGLWLCGQVMAAAGAEASGEEACRIAREVGPEPWPRELTIELTTRREVEDELRPWADRGDMDMGVMAEAVAGLAEAGDINVMLGGTGDALLHGQWAEAAAMARGVGAVAVGTYGGNLAQCAEKLMAAGVSVVEVYADAVTEGTYSSYKRGLSAERVWGQIEEFASLREKAGRAVPLVIPSMLKTPEGLEEQEEFFDRCMERSGWGVICEPTTAAGQWPWRGAARMVPPVRRSCRRIENRLTVQADGQVVMCEEDFRGLHSLAGKTVLEAWLGAEMQRIRRLHRDGCWAEHELCAKCEEFHRP